MEIVNQVVLVFVLLFVKHFVIDFPLQRPYQYKNKGTYGHPGGLLHAGLHTLGSFVLLVPVLGATAGLSLLCIAEGIVHYHLDWAKMTLNDQFGWTPVNSEDFWWLLGLDQFLHYITYALMVVVYFNWLV